MGGTNIFTVLITTIKAKVTPLVTKLKYWTSWSFLKAKVISRIRDFFTSILDIRPKHKRDYYEIFGWLVSKKLAFAAVIVVGVFSLYYLFGIHHILSDEDGEARGVKTYSYDSLLLRFASDKVKITGESGYLAYEGYVDGGAATGEGTLYGPAGNVVYRGLFDKSMYNGHGYFYYPDGTLCYQGDFKDNLYEGEGKLYRMNGSLEYAGAFALGVKEGAGTLYDVSNNPVYTGNFVNDCLQYSELLGKTTAEAAEKYTGKQILYSTDDSALIRYSDLNMLVAAKRDEDSVDAGYVIDGVYVLDASFRDGLQDRTSIADLKQTFGNPSYEGNSVITPAEAILINELNLKKDIRMPSVDMDLSQDFTEAYTINGVDDSYEIYLYSFQRDGLVYNFICRDKNEGFLFYFIEKGEGGN
ncbi:MAG: hypothetical protein E7300_02225 [Lachnospiraceae bacterium]|nr:hypothetical protein [Lachnospiraceae bacterium]